MASSYGTDRNLSCSVCGLRYDAFRIGARFVDAKREKIAVGEHGHRGGALGLMHERKWDSWLQHVDECAAGERAADARGEGAAFRVAAVAWREKYEADELEILRARRKEAGARYTAKVRELGVKTLGVGQRGRDRTPDAANSNKEAIMTKKKSADAPTEDRHDAARRARTELVAALGRCSCTWPLDVDPTTWHGHARACLGGADLDKPPPRTDSHAFVGDGCDCVDCGAGRAHHLHNVWDRAHHVMCPVSRHAIGDDPPDPSHCDAELCRDWRERESAVPS